MVAGGRMVFEGLPIADCLLPIAEGVDEPLAMGDWQLAIGRIQSTGHGIFSSRTFWVLACR